MAVLRGALLAILLSAHLMMWGVLFTILTPLKAIPAWRPRVVGLLEAIVEGWSRSRQRLMDRFTRTRFLIELPDNLREDGHYVIISNHRSWLDIPMIHRALLGRVPFIRFFVKRELLYAPVIGLAAWALDMPLMKRHSRTYLERHPERRDEDLRTTRQAMRKFWTRPGTILIFLEGTRFTLAKRDEQGGDWAHLLPPRSRGLEQIIALSQGRLDGLIDLTLTYPVPTGIFWQYLTGRIASISIRGDLRQIPAEFYTEDLESDRELQGEFRKWLRRLWTEKDRTVDRTLSIINTKGSNADRGTP